MKKLSTLIIVLFLNNTVFCQWDENNPDVIHTDDKVGIGISTPKANFHSDVGKWATTELAGYFFGSTKKEEFNSVLSKFQTAATLAAGSNWGDSSSTSGSIVNFFNQSGSRFFVQGNGQIGMGTDRLPQDIFVFIDNPIIKNWLGDSITNDFYDILLGVDGKIAAEEVKVEAIDWPDYVFQNQYPLLSIKEVEEFIQAHGHLPNIPSAKEVEENGLDLGSMQQRMMEKIEELMLYVISLHNENRSLKHELIELEQRISRKQYLNP